MSALSLRVPDPAAWSLVQLCESQAVSNPVDAGSKADAGYFFALNDLLLQCTAASFKISDEISASYFTHSTASDQSLGTS